MAPLSVVSLLVGLALGAALAGLGALAVRARSRRAGAEAEAEAARWRALLEGAPDAAFVHDGAGGALAINGAARAALGMSSGNPPPSLLDVIAVSDRGAARQHLATVASAGYARTDLRVSALGSEPRLMEVTSRAVDDGRVLSLGRDVGARRAYERGLVEARAQAEEAARVRSTFLASMSHEIRTPLTAVIGFTEILRDEVAEAQRGLVEAIEAGGQRLLATLDSVLDLATLDARRETLRPVPVDVVGEARAAVERVRAEAEAKGLRLDVAAGADALAATLDANALGRILAHLLGNAVEHTEAGGVTVEVEGDAVTVSLRVIDTGLGIPEDALPGLFAGFRTPGEPAEGGFGLAITERLVRLMGGTVSVESQWRAGTAFTVTLPRDAEVPAEMPAEAVAA